MDFLFLLISLKPKDKVYTYWKSDFYYQNLCDLNAKIRSRIIQVQHYKRIVGEFFIVGKFFFSTTLQENYSHFRIT